MSKSKVRGGAKAHRKKVQARNAEVKSRQNAMQKLFNEAMKAQIEELKKKEEMSGMTENQ
jgi:hypothetical protein